VRWLLLFLVSGCAAAATPPAGSAADAVAALQVGGRGASTGYSRAAFGQAWADTDHNGCDTRNDVLRRDLSALAVKPGTAGCVALTGRLRDPYTGVDVPFRRSGPGTVEIDHVVALSDAWQKGAAGWTTAQRVAFANDPLGLLAVSRTANRAKSASDAASWLPPARGYRCAFVSRQAAVKQKYHLRVTRAERAAMLHILRSCPDQRLPSASGW
jgi:hypothetical protein